MLYDIVKVTSISDLTSKDMKCLDYAIDQAELSEFTSSRRLGACLVIKGRYVQGV